MDTANDLYSMDFVWKLLLSFNGFSRLAIAAVAVTICVWIYALQVPTLDRVVPRVFEAGSLSMVMLALAIFVLFTITLDLSVLSAIPYALAL